MSGLKSKVLGTVLCAVLVFWCAFPVPVGVRPVDDFTHGKADAIAPAIPALVIFGTAIAAAGVYVAGTSAGTYENNLQALYNDFSRYAQSSGAANASSFDTEHLESTLSGAVTSSGGVDLNHLADAGFFGLLPAWTSALLQGGSVVEGSVSSVMESNRYVSINGLSFPTCDFSYYVNQWNSLNDVQIRVSDAVFYGWYQGKSCKYCFIAMELDTVGTDNRGSYAKALGYPKVYGDYGDRVAKSSGGYGISIYNLEGSISNVPTHLVFNADYDYSLIEGAELEDLTNGYAVVEEDVVSGAFDYPSEVVQPFTPTEAMLQEGISKVDALVEYTGASVEVGQEVNQNVEGILTQVLQITSALSPVGAISLAIHGILAKWNEISAGPFAWLQAWWNTFTGYWSTLFQKLGDTPLSTLLAPLSGLATVVDSLTGAGGVLEWLGANTLSDVVTGVGSAIGTAQEAITNAVNDVNTWLGTLSGWWEGLIDWAGIGDVSLEGLLEGVLSGALSGTLADVIEAIQAAVADITGALDGLVAVEDVDRWPDFSIAAPLQFDDTEIKAALGRKAPFAYIVAVNETLTGINGTYSSSPSFYWDVDIPFAGDIRIDAGPWLNHDVHGRTIAQLLKLSFNSFVVVMLLGFVYKAMQRAL